MTKLKLCLVLIALVPIVHFGQVEVKWNSQLPTDILWQEVTALGNLIVSSREGLMGVDTETGEVTWSSRAFGNLDRASYEELPNGPFFTVTIDGTLHMVDQFSGKEVFNSKNAGLSTISSYYLLYNSEAILVAGNDFNGAPVMVSVKMSDGSASWSLEEKFGRIIAVNELNSNELLIVTLFNNYKLNADTGSIIWKEFNSREAAQTKSLGKLGTLLMAAAEKISEDIDIPMHFYRPGNGDIFYLGSQQEKQSGMTTTNGEPNISYTNNYNAYNIKDGSLVWESDLEVNGALGHVVFLDEGILVLPDDGNRTKINLFDYDTREGKWGKKGRGINIKGGIYDYLDTGNGILLVSRTANKDYLNYLDPATGAITFEKPVKVDGTVIGIVPLGSSILYITSESMNILNPDTGTLAWKKSIQTTPNLTAEHEGKIYAFDYKSGLLKAVDMTTAGVMDITTAVLKFQGNEIPKSLEIMEDGFFLHSDQNVAKYNFDGSLSFQEYYAAPREPGWKRALLYAEAIRGAYIGATSYYVSGALSAANAELSENDVLGKEITGQLRNAYGELGDMASSYAANAFKHANARLKATQNGRDFMFIMSKQDKAITLLKVSKITGKVEGIIDLGKDREPIYAVDDITGQVYYRNDTTELTSYLVN